MWGICLDIEGSLSQAVVQYEIADNGEVLITLPETTYKPDIKYIRALSGAPKYSYGDQVSPCNHPDITGVICGIHWHFKLNCCFYTIKVNGKVKSKRYYDPFSIYRRICLFREICQINKNISRLYDFLPQPRNKKSSAFSKIS